MIGCVAISALFPGMMTAYALARIFSKLFGEVDFAAIDTDRNKYPIGKRRLSRRSVIIDLSVSRFWTSDLYKYSQLFQRDDGQYFAGRGTRFAGCGISLLLG